jgi:hypothetical protein
LQEAHLRAPLFLPEKAGIQNTRALFSPFPAHCNAESIEATRLGNVSNTAILALN